GANAALVVDAGDRAAPAASIRPLSIAGVGAIGPHGDDLAALGTALTDGRALVGRVQPFELQRYIPTADPRGLDPAARLFAAAAALAVGDAGLLLDGDRRDRAGLFLGCDQLSPSSGREYWGSLERRGLLRPSPGAFTRIVLNAPAGATATLLS